MRNKPASGRLPLGLDFESGGANRGSKFIRTEESEPRDEAQKAAHPTDQAQPDRRFGKSRRTGDEDAACIEPFERGSDRIRVVRHQVQDVERQDGIESFRRIDVLQRPDDETDVLDTRAARLLFADRDHARRHIARRVARDRRCVSNRGRPCPTTEFENARRRRKAGTGQPELVLIGGLIGHRRPRVAFGDQIPEPDTIRHPDLPALRAQRNNARGHARLTSDQLALAGVACSSLTQKSITAPSTIRMMSEAKPARCESKDPSSSPP